MEGNIETFVQFCWLNIFFSVVVLPYSTLMPPTLPGIGHCHMVWWSWVSWRGSSEQTAGYHLPSFHRKPHDFAVLCHKELNTM